MDRLPLSLWNQSLWSKSTSFSLGAEKKEEEMVTIIVVPPPKETTHSGIVHVGGAGGSCAGP